MATEAKEIDKHTNGEVVSMKHKKTDEHANSIEDKIVSYFNLLITIAIGFKKKKPNRFRTECYVLFYLRGKHSTY